MTKSANHRTQPFCIIEAPEGSATADLAWFASNPGRLFRARLANNDELLTLEQNGYAPIPQGYRMAVAIRCLSNGRILIYEFGPIEAAGRDLSELDDSAAEALFDFLLGRARGWA